MIKQEERKDNLVSTEEIPSIIYEFLDTLMKIKKIDKVINVCFVHKLTDIYVVTKEDDVNISEQIMEEFATWESSYKVFPELHIINNNEQFYIPVGASCL